MDAVWNVVLCLILFSTSYAMGRDFPGKNFKSISEFHPRTFADLLLSSHDRTKRQTHTDTTGDYDADYDYDYPIWVTTWANPKKSSQRDCRCPPSRRTGYGGSGSGYGGGTGYGTGSYGSGGYGTGPYGNSGGSGYGNVGGYGNNRDRGYPTRRRTLNRWFDDRDDYADEILVYRFYSGGEGGRRRGYQVQQGNSEGGFQEERPFRGSNDGGRGSTFEFQGGRPVGSSSSKVETDYGSGRPSTDFESIDPSGSEESLRADHGIYGVSLNQSTSNPIGKVRLFRYFAGIWEVENDYDYEESSPPTVIKIKHVGATGKTTRHSFSTSNYNPPTAAEYNQNDCCDPQRGFEGGRRVGDTGRGIGRNPYRHTTKKPNFFGITWSRMLDYSDDSEEIDADGRRTNLDVDGKKVESSSEEHAAIVEEEGDVTEVNQEGDATEVNLEKKHDEEATVEAEEAEVPTGEEESYT